MSDVFTGISAGVKGSSAMHVQPSLASRNPVASSAALKAQQDAKLDPKLVSAAHQFEASMMAELLKPLNSGSGEEDAEAGPLTSGSAGSGGALMSLGSEALAKALSEKGGMGIARRVLDHFEGTAAGAETPPTRVDRGLVESQRGPAIRY